MVWGHENLHSENSKVEVASDRVLNSLGEKYTSVLSKSKSEVSVYSIGSYNYMLNMFHLSLRITA